jgi:hypothetical protein
MSAVMSKHRRVFLLAAGTFLALNGLAQQSSRPRNMLDREGLVGAVHSVETTSALAGLDIQSTAPKRLEIYDRDGFLIERFQYDEHGSVVLHTSFTRDHATVTKEVTESVQPELSGTVVTHEDKLSQAVVREGYDSDGNLVTKMQSTLAGGPVDLVPKVANTDDGRSQSFQYDPNTHLAAANTTRKGEVVSQSASQWGKDGIASRSVSSDGTLTEVAVNPDGYVTKLHWYIPATKTDSLTIYDNKGRPLEFTQNSPETYSKTVSTYNSDGFLATETMVNRESKTTDKFRYEYQKDAQGNWIEQRRIGWHRQDASSHWIQEETVRRVIAYY